jgi:hypothetical protein
MERSEQVENVVRDSFQWLISILKGNLSCLEHAKYMQNHLRLFIAIITICYKFSVLKRCLKCEVSYINYNHGLEYCVINVPKNRCLYLLSGLSYRISSRNYFLFMISRGV